MRNSLYIFERGERFMEIVHAKTHEEDEPFLDLASWFIPIPIGEVKVAKVLGEGALKLFKLKRGLAVIKVGSHLVYQGRDAAGVIRYVGITARDLSVRASEHIATGGGKEILRYEVVEGATNLTRQEARVWEQKLINQYGLGKDGGQLINKINSIAEKNWQASGITK
jgi:hypothetical protein